MHDDAPDFWRMQSGMEKGGRRVGWRAWYPCRAPAPNRNT